MAQLNKADSLYTAGKKAAATRLYQQLVQQDQVYTGQALLRAADYYKETDQPAQALYFLHTYYSIHPNSTVRQEIQTLAEKYELTGHSIGEVEFLLFQYRRFYVFILAIPIGLLIIVLANVVRTLVYRLPLVYNPVFFSTFVLIAFLAINLRNLYQRGILSGGPIMVMDQPSAGGTAIATLPEGHKVVVRDHTDAWYRIDWQGKTGYISENHLLLLD